MCAVSQIYDYGQKTLPRQPWWGTWDLQKDLGDLGGMTSQLILSELRAQREILEKFVAMVEAAKAFDTAAHEPDCEDPKKAEFMEQISNRLSNIEKMLGL